MRALVASASAFLIASAVASEASASETSSCEVPPADSTSVRESAARKTFEEGLRREAADPEGALELYTCAARLMDRPAIELRIGTVAERLQRFDQAARAFERYLALSGEDAPDAAPMKRHIADLDKRAAPARPPPPAPAPRERAEPAAAKPIPWPAIVLFSSGAALAVTGVALLALAKSTSDDVHSLPSTTVWASNDAEGAFERARREQTWGIVALAAGAAAAVGAVVIYATSRAEVSVSAAPLGAGLVGKASF